jgi:3'-5' exoribonuclease
MAIGNQITQIQRQYVANLKEGDVVNDYFVATRKDLRNTQAGGKFLGMVFRDKTGEIGGVLWNDAVNIAANFDLGDVVQVRGTVNTYQNRLQVRVDQVVALRETDYDPAHLLTDGGVQLNELKDYTARIRTIENPHLRQLVEMFLNDEAFMDRLWGAAAGKKWHHAYRGGLVEHCNEMLKIADRVCEVYPKLDRDLLMAGVFFHDVGKLEELTQGLLLDYTTPGRLLGHLQLGCEMVNKRIAEIDGFPEELRMHLMHLILSHHGEFVNGSPVLPKTLEAIALAFIDNLDAQLNAFSRVIEETRERNQTWSDYISMIDRQIWTKDG